MPDRNGYSTILEQKQRGAKRTRGGVYVSPALEPKPWQWEKTVPPKQPRPWSTYRAARHRPAPL